MHVHQSCLLSTNVINVKKTVVYHLVNGSTVLLRIENSKNDRLKAILLTAVSLNVNVLHSSITFRLSFLLFSMLNNTIEPLTR